MKKLLLIFLLFNTPGIQAQTTAAKIRYEQAEEAFSKNDFFMTLSRLDEVQKLLGSTNPKILYLRIQAQKGIIASNNFTFTVLEEARKNVAFYLKNYEKNEGIEEKYKDVFLFADELDKLPKTMVEYSEIKEAPKKEAARIESAKLMYIDSLANAFTFKKGLTEESFRAYNTYSAELNKKNKLSKDIIQYKRKQGFTDVDNNFLYNEGPTELMISNGLASSFTYVLKKTSADKNNLYEATALFESLKARVKGLFPAEALIESNDNGYHTLVINYPNSTLVNSISIRLFDPGIFKPKYRINVVEITFN